MQHPHALASSLRHRPLLLELLSQLGNLRSQAEKMAKEQQLYKRKSPNWYHWDDACDLIERCAFSLS